MTTDLKLTKEQEAAMFQPGCFVALHPDSKHPDAGRVGKIVSRNGSAVCPPVAETIIREMMVAA